MSEQRLSRDEFRSVCQDAREQGYGRAPSDDVDDYDGYAIVGGAIAPTWMAELFGRLANRQDDEGRDARPNAK